MDKIPFNGMHDMLRAKPVPKVDVKHKVMAAIRAKENKEEKVVKKKIGLLVTVGMLVGASSVWAGVEMIQLKNEKGEVVYELSNHTDQEQQKLIQQLPPEEQAKMAEREKRSEYKSEVITEIMNGLKPGTSAAIYWKPTKEEEEEQKNITFIRNQHPDIRVVSSPIIYKTWKDMEPIVGKMFTLPTELAGGFRFEEGEVNYEENYEYKVDVEALKAKASKDNKEYAFTEIPVSNKYDYTSVAYQSDKGRVRAEVRIAEEGGAGSNAEAIEKVMIGNNEAVLMTHTSGKGENSYWIVWVKNGTKLEYSVRATEKVASKNELIKIAKQINETK
ncbi:hypothetical protein E8L90_18760 [Brevibacillus antibioticus]|uniref:DUF4367 domain-containing protein n=1 Tax=Brevibacillus antibioticus TaxID=2570228 RepID=A0A4U2YAM0_9BACL|nr:hypothetical protein [Brevibacillus antibioticus]TKI57334.1 hypothetical protein E8L90_18760 [Brevibacillus antibioticus]